ncbi:MAG: molecular chaperone DnaK [Acidobacteriota bacterium]|jgi:molecular chaperone DnaK|nr:molecular chaperone DnaK [Acidobacteriota bacterium]
MSKIIGIDLGTTNSCAAVVEGGVPTVIPTTLGSRMTKSVVHFLPNGDAVVGEHAYRTRLLDPQNTITSVKRFIGRRYNEVFDIARTVPFKVVMGRNNLALIEAHGEEYSPQYISAMILRSLKSSAEEYLGQTVEKAVVTVPAYFNDSQREATREAGRMAGLEVIRIVNEPTAAAMAYGNDKKIEETVAVFDLGGGTFDISILEVNEGIIEVKAVSGDNFLGGDDFDERIIRWVVEEFVRERGVDLTRDPFAMQLVREAAVNAKCDLSTLPQITIEVPFLPFEGQRLDGLSMVLTRGRFDELCDELFERLVSPCKVALKDAASGKVDKVILVGGATRMPRVSDVVREVFGVRPSKSVNPDEAVALGAAIQGSVLSGEKTNILLLDVVAQSLGVESEGGVMEVIVQSNTTIPTRYSTLFSTSYDNQTSVEINVVEGDSVNAVENRSLGRFVLDGIPPAPRALPEIEIVFKVDANGVLDVSARDLATGREQALTVKATTGLSEYDRDRRISDVREI